MNKTYLKATLFTLLLNAAPVVMLTCCKDYDDDIKVVDVDKNDDGLLVVTATKTDGVTETIDNAGKTCRN